MERKTKDEITFEGESGDKQKKLKSCCERCGVSIEMNGKT